MPIFGKKDPAQQQPGSKEGDPASDALGETLKGVMATMQQMQQQMSQQAQMLSQISQQSRQEPPAPQHDPLEGVDLEGDMDSKQLLEIVGKLMDQKFSGFKQELDPRLSDLSTKVSQKEIRDQIKETASKIGEERFWLYREDMRKLANQYPDLDPRDLYTLAEQRNPTPGQEYDVAKAQEESDKEGSNIRPFGGLTPTSSRTTSEGEKMSYPDAASKAWDEAMSEVPPELVGGSNN